MAEKKRIEWIDTLKGFSMYTIVLCHVNVYTPLRNWLVSFNMPIYFMTSGATLNIEKVRKTPFSQYFSSLFKRLIVPYMWLQMLSFLTRYAVNLAGAHKEVPVVDYLKGILVGNNKIIGTPSNPLYYIYMLFLAQIGLWIIIRVTKGNKGYMAAILTAFSIVSVCTQNIALPWHINGVPNVMLSIFIGRLLMDVYLQNKKHLNRMSNGMCILVCAVLFAVGYITLRLNGTPSTHGNKFGDDYIVYLIGGFSTCVAFALIAMRLRVGKLFSFVGMNTLFYMGIHKPVLLLFEEIFEKYEDSMLFVVPASIVCFLMLVPLAKVANKYFPYINGNSVKEETTLIKAGKYVAVAAAWAVPYMYFNNHFMDGFLRESIGMMVLSAVAYIVAVVIATTLINKFVPSIFLIDYKTNKAVKP